MSIINNFKEVVEEQMLAGRLLVGLVCIVSQ